MAEILSLFPEEQERSASVSLFPDDSQRLTQSVAEGSNTPSDKASRVFKLQFKTGLPVGLIENNVDYLEDETRKAAFNAENFRAKSPLLAEWVARNKNNAALAKNDIENLSMLEKVFNAFGSGFAQVDVQGQFTEAQMPAVEGKKLTQDQQAKVESLNKISQQLATNKEGYGVLESAASMTGYGLQTFIAGGLAGLRGAGYGGTAGAVLGAPIGGVGAAPGFVAWATVGGAMGIANYTYRLEAASSFYQFKNTLDVDGKPMDDETARIAAQTVGAINAVIEVGSDIALAAIWGLLPAGIAGKAAAKAAVSKGIAETLAVPTKRTAFLGAAKKLLASGFTEGLEEFLQNFVSSRVQDVAESGQTFKKRPLSEETKEGLAQAAEAFGSTILSFGLIGSLPMARTIRNVNQAQRTQEFFKALGSGVSESDMHKKLPEATRDFVQTLKQAGPIENVYVDVNRFDTLFQGEGPKVAEQLGIGHQYAEAKALNADLVIPVEVYAEKLAGTEFHGQLMPDLRLRQEDLSLREAQEAEKASDAAAKEQTAKEEETFKSEAPLRAVYEDVYKQLTPFMGESEANRNAVLWMERYRARADRLGVDPLKLYQEKPLIVRKDLVATPDADVMEQSVFHGTPHIWPPEPGFPHGRPRLDKIGTGEGAQAYGWGWYSAENAQVGTEYARKGVTQNILDVTPENDYEEAIQSFVKAEADLNGVNALDIVNEQRRDIATFVATRDAFTSDDDAMSKALQAIDALVSRSTPSSLYRLDIPNDVLPKLLDWDKPLSEQTKEVKAALKGTGFANKPTTSGKTIYDNIAITKAEESGGGLGRDGDQKAASEYLASIGIPGNKYLDQGSRGKGDGTYNYVLWDQKVLDRVALLERNGEKLDAMRGADVLAQTSVKDQTQTPEFKAWFGASKVVDAEGRPLVVYHGTPDPSFNKFALRGGMTGELGFWFTSNADATAPFRRDRYADQGAATLPVFLTLKNPMVYDGWKSLVDAVNAERRGRSIEEGSKSLRRKLMRAGYDGIINRGTDTDSGILRDDFVAFRPEQIKSATGNVGTFDAANPNILKQNIRGQIQLSTNTITLLRKADPSTFLHESGHSWLEEIRADAMREGAPQQLVDDWNQVKQWAGIQEGAIPVEAHEQFARGIELYLREGQAPSNELRQVFARFKDWLVRIYRKALDLDVEISPEIRAVMDRMLATDEQIAVAREQAGVNEALPSAWMTSAEAKAYEKLRGEAKEEAESSVRVQLMKELVRERTDFWKAEKARTREEVEAEINTNPIYIALSVLQTGKLPDGREMSGLPENVKLSKQALISQYGEDFLKSLPKPYIYQSEGGLHPDVAAQMFGIQTGDEMLRAMQTIKPRKQAITEEVESRMIERHGDLMTDGLAGVAAEAVANEKQMAVFYREMQILRRQGATGQLMSLQAIKELARSVVARKTIGELHPAYYQHAAAKAGRDALNALYGKSPQFARKVGAAFDARQRQLINLAIFAEASRSKRQVEKALRDWRVLNRKDEKLAKTRNMDLVNTARAILANFGVGNSDRTPMAYMELMAQYDPQTYQDMAAIVQLVSDTRKPWKDMTMDEFYTVQDAVDGLWSMAKSTNQMEIDGKKIERQTVKNELFTRLAEFNKPAVKRGYDKAVTQWEKTKIGLIGVRSALRRVESWVDAVDGDSQAFRKYVWQPISEAATHYRELRKINLDKYLELVKGVEKTITIDKIDATELGYTFGANGSGKAELIGALLHTGNQSNMTKLLVGRGWGELREDETLDTSRWDAFIRRMQTEGKLTEADYDFVQSVGNLMESLKAGAQAAHKKMYGYYFAEVTANEVVTPWKTYPGWYYPAITDPWVVSDAALREDQAAMEAQQNSFMFPTTGRGFTKQRVKGYQKALMLDMRLIPQHIDKVLKFSIIEPHIKDVGRLMLDKEFRSALEPIDPTAIGSMLMPWLQRSATQAVDTPATDKAGRMLDTIAREVRSRTGAQIMVANVTNTLQQFTGLSLSATKVPPSKLASSLWRYMRSPSETGEMIAEKSEFMRNRVTASVMEVQKNIDDILLNPSKYEKARSFARQHGYFMQVATQSIVDVVAWGGAYDHAIGQGMSEKEAVRHADSVVRLTQGTFAAEDISRFETGSPLMRLFTMFYSYFNMQANLLGTEFSKAMRKNGFTATGRLFYIYVYGFMIPAVLSEALVQLMSGEAWKDDDDDGYIDNILSIFFGGQARTATAFVPAIGPAIQAGINAWNDKWYDDRISSSPAVSMLESAVHTPVSVYKYIAEEGSAKRAIKDSLTLIGLLTGLPVAPLGRPLGYMADVAQGKVEPSGPIDYSRGLISGRSQ